jgi:hypothetical protein
MQNATLFAEPHLCSQKAKNCLAAGPCAGTAELRWAGHLLEIVQVKNPGINFSGYLGSCNERKIMYTDFEPDNQRVDRIFGNAPVA